MQDPDIVNCPGCGTPKSGLRLRHRITEHEDGSISGGTYMGCEPDCNALTQSPSNGKYNLRDDVAEAFGVQRKTSATVQARIQPKIRRVA